MRYGEWRLCASLFYGVTVGNMDESGDQKYIEAEK